MLSHPSRLNHRLLRPFSQRTHPAATCGRSTLSGWTAAFRLQQALWHLWQSGAADIALLRHHHKAGQR